MMMKPLKMDFTRNKCILAGRVSPVPVSVSRPWRISSNTVRRPRTMRVAARLDVERFAGTNVYYLLMKSKKGFSEGNQVVLRTLDQVKEVGFTVIRAWAFQDDPDPAKGGTLQYKDSDGKIKYNQDMLDGLSWLLDQCQQRGLKLMLTLTNGNPHEFGGMRQYVRWANNLPNEAEVSNGAFFRDSKAQALFRDYLAFMIPKFKDHPAVHSWDLANEPRNDEDPGCQEMTAWINQTASFVKSLDAKTPITVGLDGFFGPSSPELAQGDAHNPYYGNPYIEGCDFVANSRSPDLDFASIHLYPWNWSIAVDKRVSFSERWVRDHVNVIKDPKYGMGNIPLVLQEYNLSHPNDSTRTQLFQSVSNMLVSDPATKDILKGSMIWMLADPSEARWDSEDYYLYAPSVSNDVFASSASKGQLNLEQMAVQVEMSKKVCGNVPSPA